MKKKKLSSINDPTYNALSAVIMNRSKDKNFVDRAYNPQNYPVINNQDGSYSTHRMAYDTNPDGTGIVYPTIVQSPTGELVELNSDDAYKYAAENNEYITTPSWKMADYLSNQGYKNATNMAKKKYQKLPEYQYGNNMNPWGVQPMPQYYPQQPQQFQVQDFGQPMIQPIASPARNSGQEMQLLPPDKTAMGSRSNPMNVQQSPQSVGMGAAQQFGAAAGALGRDAINGGVQLLNALIPDQPQRRNTFIPPTYNANPYGTGSQAIYEDGGSIHIKPENRGKFIAAANRAGMGVQEYAQKVLHDPDASSTMKKRANFARNAAKWNHEDGGTIRQVSSSKKNKRFTATEEVPFMQPQENFYLPVTSPIQEMEVSQPYYNPQTAPVPYTPPSVDYQPLYDVNQNITGMNPVFYNSTYGQARNMFDELPTTYNGYPVVNTEEAYRELNQNFRPFTNSSQWRPFREDMNYGGKMKKKCKTGGYISGKEYSISEEEFNRLQSLGYQLTEL